MCFFYYCLYTTTFQAPLLAYLQVTYQCLAQLKTSKAMKVQVLVLRLMGTNSSSLECGTFEPAE